jgi:hypothetical protein
VQVLGVVIGVQAQRSGSVTHLFQQRIDGQRYGLRVRLRLDEARAAAQAPGRR